MAWIYFAIKGAVWALKLVLARLPKSLVCRHYPLIDREILAGANCVYCGCNVATGFQNYVYVVAVFQVVSFRPQSPR